MTLLEKELYHAALRCTGAPGTLAESEYRGTSSTTASGQLLLAPKIRIKEMTSGIRDLFSLVAEDYRVHGSDWTRPGFRALAVYRFGIWRKTIASPYVRAPFSMLYRAAYRYCRNIYGIELPDGAMVGRGVVIEHQGGIVIHGASVIGDRCIVRQNCTLGIRSSDAPNDAPTLTDGVSLGAGAVVLGRVTIGKDAVIGANAVVLQDVPPGATAVGVPARIVRKIASGQDVHQLTHRLKHSA